MDKSLLYKHFKGDASSSERKAVRTWVEASADHYDEYIRERKLFDASLLLSPHEVRRSLKVRLMRLGRMTAAAAAVFALGILFQHFNTRPEEGLMQRIVVPMGQRVNLQLADGTDVWLNSGSEFTYSTTFSKSDRRVTLDGEGYFKVTKDTRHPFRVETACAAVEVLGTEFDLAVSRSTGDFRTSLVEGSVRIEAGDAWTVLKPNESATLHNGTFVISEIADNDEFLWRDGILSFAETPFIELMKRFEQFYGVKIRVDNRRMAGYSAMGKFRQADGVEHALRVLASDAGFDYVFDDKNQLIIIK